MHTHTHTHARLISQQDCCSALSAGPRGTTTQGRDLWIAFCRGRLAKDHAAPSYPSISVPFQPLQPCGPPIPHHCWHTTCAVRFLDREKRTRRRELQEACRQRGWRGCPPTDPAGRPLEMGSRPPFQPTTTIPSSRRRLIGQPFRACAVYAGLRHGHGLSSFLACLQRTEQHGGPSSTPQLTCTAFARS